MTSKPTPRAKHETAIQARDVSFQWSKKAALSDVSLSLTNGQMMGLLGPNGAGKTTLISLIAGLIEAHRGSIFIHGQTMGPQESRLRKQLGFVFQSVSLDRFLTVRQNLEYAAGLQGLSISRTRHRIESLTDLFNLAPLLKQPAGSLSGGQKRLVDIARALLHSPSILVLDEPTTALDPSAKQHLWGLLQKLKADFGLSVLVATHLMDEAQDCDQVAFLNNGRIQWLGTPEQALNEMPDQSLTSVRKVNLSDWFVWKLTQARYE